MWSTNPKVHNLLHCRQRKTGPPRPRVGQKISWSLDVSFLKICKRTDIQTDPHADTLVVTKCEKTLGRSGHSYRSPLWALLLWAAGEDRARWPYSTRTGIYIQKSEASVLLSVSLYHGQHAVRDRRYFLASCDKRKHTGHAHQQAASQASTDSAWRHPVWLPYSSVGFQRPVGRRSYHNKLACAALLRLTPEATIARSAIVDCYGYSLLDVCVTAQQRHS